MRSIREPRLGRVLQVCSGQVTKRIGRYHVVGQLGAGAMGEVFLAEDRDLNRRVAVKVIHPDVAHSTAARSRFRREARALAALNVPGVVTIHEIGEDDGRDFIAMEFVAGQPLREAVAEGMPLADLFAIGAEAAQALAAAHAAGVLHRDVKPDNLMVTSERQLKLVDFGIARHEPEAARPSAVNEGDASIVDAWVTQEGAIVGTPGYMAPETLSGAPATEQSDTYALGVTLYELIGGEHPFDAASPQATIRRILAASEPPRLPATTPTPAVDLIGAMMARDPEVRPPLADVVQCLRGLSDDSGPDVAASAGSGVSALAPTLDAQTLDEPRPSRRAAVGLTVMAAVVMGAVGVWYADQPSVDPEASTEPDALPVEQERFCLAIPPFAADVEGLSESRSDGMAHLFGTLLRSVREIDVVSSQNLRSVVALRTTREPEWDAAARELSATHIIEARVSGHDGAFEGEVRVVSLEDGSELGLVSAREEVLDTLLNELAQGVARLCIPDAVIPPATGHSVTGLEDYELGARALNRQEWAGAITHLERAVDVNPEFFEAWYQLALARLWAPATTEETLAAARRAVELATTDRDRAVTRGYLAYLTNESAEAIRLLEPMYDENPRDRDVAYVLAEALYHSGRYSDGIAVFERVLIDAPSFGLAALHPVRHAITMRDEPRARMYEQMLRAEDDEPTRYVADLDFAMGRYEEAAAETSPVDVRAGALVMLGRDAEATALLERTHAPDAAELLLYRVARAAARGDDEAAAEGTEIMIRVTRQGTTPFRWFSIRQLAEVLIAAGALEPLHAVLALLADSDSVTVDREVRIHAATLLSEVDLPADDDMPPYYVREADAVRLEREGQHAEAVEIWMDILTDTSEHYEFLERTALRRNLLALDRTEEAEAICDDLGAPPVWRPAVIVTRAICGAD